MKKERKSMSSIRLVFCHNMKRIEVNQVSEEQSIITIRKLFIIFVFTLAIFILLLHYESQPSNCTWRKIRANQEFELELCPIRPPNLTGSIDGDAGLESIESIEERLEVLKNVKLGGSYKPPNCLARDRVAVIVPCRGEDREQHIPVLIKSLHPMMMRQQLEYQIFIVFQTPGLMFNKGALMNAGFLEAMKVRQWDCMIFHDIDTIPMDDRNMYDCPRANPRHLAVDVDRFGFKLLSESFVGGVIAFTPAQYEKINGFSNSFWGWGGDDQDLYNRIRNAGYYVERYPHFLTRYKSAYHEGGPINYEWLAINPNNLTNRPKMYSYEERFIIIIKKGKDCAKWNAIFCD